jgi:hypothetical protein
VSDLRKNLIAYLQDRFKCITIEQELLITDPNSSNASISIWPMIAFSHTDGIKHRALAIPNFGESTSISLIVEKCNEIFERVN